jgi:putative phage-type endonuclease
MDEPSVSETNLFDSFSEDEIHDFEENIIDVIEHVLENEVIHQSNPNSFSLFVQKIVEYFYQDWIHSETYTEDDYEDIYEYIEEFFTQFLETIEHEFPPRQSINTQPQMLTSDQKQEIAQKIGDLQCKYQPAQRTEAWYEYRHNLITASNIYKTLGSDSQRNSIIYEKCKPFTANKINYFSQDPRQWGTICEPISIMLYEHLYSTQVADFGCIQHAKYPCIGASPDGINVDPTSDRFGRMIEVKNIVNREITTVPKEEYWIQMQVQMETCDLDECDFIETRFKAFDSEEAFYEDTSDHQKGVYMCFVENIRQTVSHVIPGANDNNIKTIYLTGNSEGVPKYVYMPLDIECNKPEIDTWIQQQKMNLRSTHTLYSVHYWYLDEFSCILVKRNRLWFQAALPKILETWDIIEQERKTGYEHRAAKKRTSSIDILVPETATPDTSMMRNIV